MAINSIFQSNNGLIRFYDGTIIAIEIREYSHDGISQWEELFNPYGHISTTDGVTELQGHLYTRVKHTGDTNYQLPYRIIPKEPIFRVEEGILEWKYLEDDDSTYTELLDTETLRGVDGIQGEQGIKGDGININEAGYINSRQDCCSSLSTSSCNSCNTSGSTSVAPYLYLSIGDGTLIITSDIITANLVIVDGVTYTHFSNDLITWTAFADGIVDFEVRYLATNATGAVHSDMRTEDYYSTRGKVYICADGTWTEFVSLTTPLYMVQETAGSTNIGYLDNFVEVPSNTLTTTIGISDGKLEVIQYSIDSSAFKTGTFGDGLDYTQGDTEVKAKVEDFDGFGLITYTAIDGEEDLQVDLTALVSDGIDITSLDKNGDLVIPTDGSSPILIKVTPDDIISPTTAVQTGLWTSTDAAITETDGFDNIYVKPGDAILVDLDGVNVKADELSLTADGLPEIKIFETNNTTLGVTNEHINMLVVDPLAGLQKGNGTVGDITGKLNVKLDTVNTPASLGFNGIGEIEIPLNAIQGIFLNDNTCNNLAGVEILGDAINVKVDGTTIDFNGSGELQSISSGLIQTDLTNLAVWSITTLDNSVVGNTVENAVTFNIIPAIDGGIDTTFTSNGNTGEIVFNLGLDYGHLDSLYAPLGGGAVEWGNITGTITDQLDLIAYLDGLNHVVLNTLYDNIQINDGTGVLPDGFLITAPTGEVFKLIVDANGNLDTTPV